MEFIPFDKPELFMTYENPTGCATQGFAIYDKYGFMMFHTGRCCVYDLESRTPSPLAVFKLASYNSGTPDKRFANHANQAMFLGIEPAPGSDFPYLMVNIGNSGEKAADGYIVRADIERINHDFTCETVHTIIFTDNDAADYPFAPIGWGWPAFSMDVANRFVYILSARHRTTYEEFEKHGENMYVITKLAFPENVSGDRTVLSCKDIIDQFECEFDIFFTQGGMFDSGLLYHTFGCRQKYPDGIRVYNPAGHQCVCKLDLGSTIMGDQELEACSFYKNTLLCNTEKGIYAVGTKS